MQLFWQAFPAHGGSARTTYMFTYADCAKQRPSLKVGALPSSALLRLDFMLMGNSLLRECGQLS
jgi:hypothetical protein